jgi:hypothetical protein
MRRNDAPDERGALADTPAAGPDVPRRRPDDDHLRQRLAGLRASHPSSPEYRGGQAASDCRDGEPEHRDAETEPAAASPDAAKAGPGGAARDGDLAAGDGQARAADAERDGAGGHDGADGHAGPGERGGEGRGPAEGETGGLPGPEGRPPHGEPSHARPGHGELGRPVPLGSGEPYRPWFSSGEPLEPWFTADPCDPPG